MSQVKKQTIKGLDLLGTMQRKGAKGKTSMSLPTRLVRQLQSGEISQDNLTPESYIVTPKDEKLPKYVTLVTVFNGKNVFTKLKGDVFDIEGLTKALFNKSSVDMQIEYEDYVGGENVVTRVEVLG